MDEDVIRIGIRGRITIPKTIRDKYNLRYRDTFRIHVVGGLVLLERVEKQRNAQGTVSLETFLE